MRKNSPPSWDRHRGAAGRRHAEPAVIVSSTRRGGGQQAGAQSVARPQGRRSVSAGLTRPTPGRRAPPGDGESGEAEIAQAELKGVPVERLFDVYVASAGRRLDGEVMATLLTLQDRPGSPACRAAARRLHRQRQP